MSNENRLRVKEVPTRVEKQPVIKSSFLGWQPNLVLAQTPGYFAYVITYDTTTSGEPNAYSVHLMQATALDGRWLRIESRRGLFWNEAEAAFAEHDKLAIRPGRN
jgi:hypothetical protein